MSDSDDQFDKPVTPKRLMSYTCPGESYSISHSIHLARLAAFYSKCQDCEYRFDAEHLYPRESERHPVVEQRTNRASLLTDESVRGVYLNELDRNKALAWGEALAAVLWDQAPMLARQVTADDSQIIEDPPTDQNLVSSLGPTVVVGFDERPSSPDIVSGIVLGLRRMGCSVIDLGQTNLPIVAFHLQKLKSNAGLFVTGAGSDPSVTGFELLAHNGLPFSRQTLEQMELNSNSVVARQSRHIGRHVPIQGQTEYEVALASHFHALRPLKIVCGTATRLTPRILDRLFNKLPCKLTHISLPARNRNLLDSRDSDLQRVAKAVIDTQQHLGVVIDEDAQHLAFVTDRGRLVTPKDVARILIEFAQRENHAAQFVVLESQLIETAEWLEGRDADVIGGKNSTLDLVRTLTATKAALAIASDGRVWFDHEHPTCDAIRVFASMLQALSLNDTPFSEVVARINSARRGAT